MEWRTSQILYLVLEVCSILTHLEDCALNSDNVASSEETRSVVYKYDYTNRYLYITDVTGSRYCRILALVISGAEILLSFRLSFPMFC